VKNLKYFGLTLVVSIGCVFIWLGILPSQASVPSVQLQTQPPLSQIIPDGEPVQVTLQAIDAVGQSLSDARFQLQLFAPAKTPWFTSDFPIVEGTTLLELDTLTPYGKLQFEQILPIRGDYWLKVRVAPSVAGVFEPFDRTLQFSVPENPLKFRNAAILVSILLLAGFGGGWIIGGDQTLQSGEVAPQKVRLLLSGVIVIAIAVLLYVNISAELISSHDHGTGTEVSPNIAVQRSLRDATRTPDLEIRLSGDQKATVGELANQTVQVLNLKTGKPEAGVTVKAQTISLEDNKQMFAYQGTTDTKGQLTWKEQFFDGAPYQVSVEAIFSDGKPMQVAHEVEVKEIEPPLYIRLISLIYFTAFFVIGLWSGFWLHRRFRLLGVRW
jgi:5-hydroxyisourate hydrolase-like protein (transthyretin family)